MTSSESPQSVVDVPDTKTKEQPDKATLANWCATQWPALLAELLATTMLVLFGCMSCLPLPGSTEHLSPLYTPLAFGFTVMMLVQIFGHISGAHMNPVVTVIAIIWGTMTIPTGIVYFFIQIIGAIAGYGILVGISPVDLTEGAICLTLPHDQLSYFQAIGVEIVVTAVLGFLCCSVWDPRNKEKQDSAPIKFGLTIIAVSISGGPLTGASLNPARSLAPALWTGIWTAQYVYWVGPFVGGILSVLMYKFLFIERIQKNENGKN